MNDNEPKQRCKPGPKPKNAIQRGETGAGMAPGMAQANAGVVSGDRESNAHGVNRHNRVPMGGASQTLTLPPHIVAKMEAEDKHLHYVRDDSKGRLQQTINAGYEHVVDEQGNNIYRDSGAFKLYLMAIPNAWHEEDKALKRRKAAASLGKEATIREGEYSPTNSGSAVNVSESDRPD